MKHAGGRPTDYSPKLLEKAKEYLQHCEQNSDLPQIAGLALYLDISRETVYAWSKEEDKREFSDIVTKVLVSQEYNLVKNGLENKYNPSITKLMLTKHGYTDKTDVTSDGKALPTPILNGLSSNDGTKETT